MQSLLCHFVDVSSCSFSQPSAVCLQHVWLDVNKVSCQIKSFYKLYTVLFSFFYFPSFRDTTDNNNNNKSSSSHIVRLQTSDQRPTHCESLVFPAFLFPAWLSCADHKSINKRQSVSVQWLLLPRCHPAHPVLRPETPTRGPTSFRYKSPRFLELIHESTDMLFLATWLTRKKKSGWQEWRRRMKEESSGD